MIQDDTELERLDSLTVRHLRELRRRMDEYFELLKRSVEMDGRTVSGLGSLKVDMERQLNEVRSDLILLENRSLTALEHDAWFRTKLNRIDNAMDAMRADMDGLRTDMSVMRADVSSLHTDISVMRTDVDGLRADVDGLRTDMSVMRADVDGLRTDMSVMRADVDGLRTDMSVMRADVDGLRTDMDSMRTDITGIVFALGQVNSKLDIITDAFARPLFPKETQQ